MNPLISIIIPCHNSSKYISEILTNILSQTYTNFECIIIDDGSTDDTGLIIKKVIEKDKRVTYHYQKNEGVASARNSGIKISTGEFIQFLDADDLIHPEKLKIQLEYLLKNPSVDITYGEYLIFNEIGEIDFTNTTSLRNNFTKKIVPKSENVLNYFVYDNITSIHAPLSRRKVVDIVNFDPIIKNCEDYDFWFHAAIEGFNFRYYANLYTTCYYRRHTTNKSLNSSRMNYYRSLIKQKYMPALKEKKPELFPVLYSSFILNHKRYLFEKNKKNLSDIKYSYQLACQYNSIQLLWITIEYILVPNHLLKLIHWNGGLYKYFRLKTIS